MTREEAAEAERIERGAKAFASDHIARMTPRDRLLYRRALNDHERRQSAA